MTLATREASTWNLILAQAETISRTNFVPANYRGKPAEIAACILSGRELGIGPMQSLQQIHVIDGKPSASAELQVALVRAAGHSIVPTVLTDTACTVVGKRADNGDTLEFTFDSGDAERAGLTKKSNWRNYPQSMLWARAVSQVCRMLFPDVLVGLASYTPEEMGSDEWVAEEPQVLATEVVATDPTSEESVATWLARESAAIFDAAGITDEAQRVMLKRTAASQVPGWEETPDLLIAVLAEKVNEVSGSAVPDAATPPAADPEQSTNDREEGTTTSTGSEALDASEHPPSVSDGGDVQGVSLGEEGTASPPSDDNLRALVRLMRDAPAMSAAADKLRPWVIQVLTVWPRDGVDATEVAGWKAAAVRQTAAALAKEGAEWLTEQGVKL